MLNSFQALLRVMLYAWNRKRLMASKDGLRHMFNAKQMSDTMLLEQKKPQTYLTVKRTICVWRCWYSPSTWNSELSTIKSTVNLHHQRTAQYTKKVPGTKAIHPAPPVNCHKRKTVQLVVDALFASLATLSRFSEHFRGHFSKHFDF